MAVTPLSPGDIAVIGYNSDDPDTFSFVALKPIGSGTVIRFTDQSWNGSTFSASGTDSTITFTASADIAAGTVIPSSSAQFSGTLNLDSAGDTIYAYQGAINTPTTFLYAIEFADGNAAFGGSLANTGLSLTTMAVGVAFDNAYFGGSSTGIQQTELARISTSHAWIGSDTVRQTAESGPLLPPDIQLWTTDTGGAGGGLSHVDDNAGVASNLATFFTNNVFLHPAEITFDTVHDKVFIADDGGGPNYSILEGSISQFVNNPGVNPTFTVLATAHPAAANDIRDIEIDPTNHCVYFLADTKFEYVTYNPTGASTANQTPTVIADPPNNVGFEFDLDLTSSKAYFVDSEFQTVFNPAPPPTLITAATENAIYRVNSLAPGATVDRLPFTPDDQSGNTPPDAFPVDHGTLSDVVVDDGGTVSTADDRLVFTTESASGSTAGVFTYNLNGNASGTWGTLWTQPATGALDAPDNPITEIHLDTVNHKYYITIQNSLNNGTAGIYHASLSGGTPTLFQAINGTVGGTAEATGITLDHQPTLSVTSASVTFTEAVTNPASASVTRVNPISAAATNDIDTTGFAQNLAGATVAVSSDTFFTGDQLTIGGATSGTFVTGGANIAFTYNSSTGVMSLTGADTFAHYQAALAAIQYGSTSDNPTNYGNDNARTIQFAVSDGLISSDVQTASVTVVGINDAPVNNIGGATATGNEDTPFSITGLSITDVDADPANQDITVTLSVLHGTLTFNTAVAGGIIGADITGGANGSNTITITATQNQINATLASGTGLQYQGNLNFNTGFAAENLHIVTSDQGFNGTGGPLTDTDDLSITVTAVNDNPNLQPDTTTAVSYTENAAPTALFAGENVDTPLADVDQSANYSGGSIDLQITAGLVTGDRIDLTGARFVIVAGNIQDTANGNAVVGTIGATNATSHVTVSALTANATPSVVDALIQSFGFDSTSDNPGSGDRTVTLTFNDGGNTGSGGALTDAVTQTVQVTPVNDAPVATITPTSYAATEQVNLSLKNNGLAVSDVDGNAGNETVTLSVTEGTLTLGTGTSGVIIDSGNGTSSVTFHGTLAQLNDLLNTNATSTCRLQRHVRYAGGERLAHAAHRRRRQHRHRRRAHRQRHRDHQHHGGERRAERVDDDRSLLGDRAGCARPQEHRHVGVRRRCARRVRARDAVGGRGHAERHGGRQRRDGLQRQRHVVRGRGRYARAAQCVPRQRGGEHQYAELYRVQRQSGRQHDADAADQRQGQHRHRRRADRHRYLDHQHHGGERRAGRDHHAGELHGATEQVNLNLKNNGLSVSDVDGNSGSETVTLSVTEGTLTVTAGTSGAVVTNSGTSSVTITGTVAQINALLNTDGTSTVSYIDSTDTPAASTTLTLLIHDNGNTGTGGDCRLRPRPSTSRR